MKDKDKIKELEQEIENLKDRLGKYQSAARDFEIAAKTYREVYEILLDKYRHASKNPTVVIEGIEHRMNAGKGPADIRY